MYSGLNVHRVFLIILFKHVYVDGKSVTWCSYHHVRAFEQCIGCKLSSSLAQYRPFNLLPQLLFLSIYPYQWLFFTIVYSQHVFGLWSKNLRQNVLFEYCKILFIFLCYGLCFIRCNGMNYDLI